MSVDSNTPLDPRIQLELEKLNSATDNINRFEVELEEAKSEFQRLLGESVERIKKAAHKLGNSIQTAKPYYEARLYASQLTKETQAAQANYDKARSIHAAAKEMVFLAEQGLGEKSSLDMACQEMLNHAASRVNQSQAECSDTRNALKICELKQEVANNRVAKLQSQLKGAIRSSSLRFRRNLLMINSLALERQLLSYCSPYYETRANYNGVLKQQKVRIEDLDERVSAAKSAYNDALKRLEEISEEIHRLRKEREGGGTSSNSDREEDDNGQSSIVSHISSSSGAVQAGTSHGPVEDPMDDVINRFNSTGINSTDEYMDFPKKMTTKSSPVRQKKVGELDCPHMYQDFTSSKSGQMTNEAIEQWTEIRLSPSESSSSGYSNASMDAGGTSQMVDDATLADDSSSSSNSESNNNKKVTCTTVFPSENMNNGGGNTGDKREGLSSWLSKSGQLKSTGRRQSLDLLIDASDRVKDVFTNMSFTKVGKGLERRNSESEIPQTEQTTTSSGSDFFSFRSDAKEGLSDEQVLNLNLELDKEHNSSHIVTGLRWSNTYGN